MASNVITVTLLGDASKLNKAFGSAQASAKTFGDKMTGAGSALTAGLTLPIVAGAGLAVKAASEEAQEMETLAGAIRKNIPGATDEAIAANEAWITSMQNATGIADGELRNAIQQLVQAGVPLAKAQDQVADAMDISVAKHIDLATVTNALVKANKGNTGALGKMGLATKDASGEALTLDQILQNAADTMGGSAATAADTAAGRAAIMQAKMADLAETLGSMLLPILERLVAMLSTVFDWFNNLAPGAQKFVGLLLAVAAAAGPVLLGIGKVIAIWPTLIQGFKAVGTAWSVLSKLFMANPWVLLIAAVIALVVLIVMNWDKIVAFLKKTWDWIVKTSAAVWNGIKAALKAALDWIVQLFLNWTLAGLIIKHWDKIKAGVSALVQWLKDIWNGLVDWFRQLPGRIGGAVAGLFDGIRDAFRNAINWVIRKWNSFRLSIKLPGILGGGSVTIDTPNIPTFHGGGVFHAARPGGEGLALLRDRERVSVPGARAPGGDLNINITAGLGTDPNALGKAVFEALQRYQRINGALPLDVRLN